MGFSWDLKFGSETTVMVGARVATKREVIRKEVDQEQKWEGGAEFGAKNQTRSQSRLG